MTVSVSISTRKSPGLALLLLGGLLSTASGSAATDADALQPPVLKPAEVEFFESKIRPLLVERCYACHSAEPAPMGGLRLDTREGWAIGGSRGPAIVPGNPAGSLLIQAVNYQDPNLSMPPEGTLPPEEIELLEQWVGVGAPDPRSDASGATPVQDSIDLEEGRKFWSFQPLAQPALPAVEDQGWIRSSLDRFVLARLEEKGLESVGPAGRRTWLRRVTLDLTGAGKHLDLFELSNLLVDSVIVPRQRHHGSETENARDQTVPGSVEAVDFRISPCVDEFSF